MSSEIKKKDITIYDLAENLKISPSTVSRALNDHTSIGDKTKTAVKKLALEMGYKPNVIASSLRTNKSNTIGIIVSWINRPFISSLISGVEDAAKEAGYHVIITQSHDDVEEEKNNLKALYAMRVSALIVSLAMKTSEYSHFDLFSNSGIPVVFVDRIPKIGNIAQVKIDNFQAGYEATRHLINQSCVRIAHFGGASNQTIYEDRMNGYKQALIDHNIKIDPALIFHANILNAEEGVRMTEELLMLKELPDGIFCVNDTAGVSVIKTLKKNSIRIPEDIAIIGFNNDPICQIIEPNLSTINHPAALMGKNAVLKVLDIIDNGVSTLPLPSISTEVIVRASSLRSTTQK